GLQRLERAFRIAVQRGRLVGHPDEKRRGALRRRPGAGGGGAHGRDEHDEKNPQDPRHVDQHLPPWLGRFEPLARNLLARGGSLAGIERRVTPWTGSSTGGMRHSSTRSS